MAGPSQALLAIALAGAAMGACASPLLMPDGSSEFAAGAILGSGERDDGSAERATYLRPYFEAQWSNGLFMNGLWLGKHLSDDSHFRYGPMVLLVGTRERDRGKSRRVPVLGAFASYRLLHNLSLAARGFRIGGDGGALLDMHLIWGTSLGPHHGLSLSAGARLADRRYLEAQLNVPAGASGGLKDVYGEAHWRWELSTKYTMVSGAEWNSLRGSAAASAQAARRAKGSYSVGLIRSF